ncbi:hypothetical protein VTN49DRAFT_6640 [Thermomyces lanuginosus]|uniref:uncharacterized protein n=1 Tax=Thermomyces lanuginosus TaxID=5541 RepID=UPI003743EA83
MKYISTELLIGLKSPNVNRILKYNLFSQPDSPTSPQEVKTKHDRARKVLPNQFPSSKVPSIAAPCAIHIHRCTV